MRGDHDPRSGERGESLVETMAAMLILLIVLVGTLQLQAMALVSQRSSDAQRDMTESAEKVVELIRVVRATGATGTSGILPLSAGTRPIPTTPSDSGWGFWGPAGYRVVEPSSRYRLSYRVEDAGDDWLVTVVAEPRSDGESEYVAPIGRKGARYAARIPK